ncbi:MAG TPA: succinate dehydrogenase, hydrophobic membrane anchor protein [Ktedonobacterales bacterium]|nr:succinate dehydrogenase, hydrophobic membrane anchor protein [Ktedonobacterales bacterium]
MATQTRTPTKVTEYGATSRPARGGSSWETFSWWFFRVSGVGLIFLAIIHVIIMHVTNDVSATGYAFVAARYKNPFWRVYDLLLLTLALLHGLNGLRIVCDDYIRTRGTRLAVLSALFIIAIGFWLMGSMTIVTFQPGQTVTQAMLHMIGH